MVDDEMRLQRVNKRWYVINCWSRYRIDDRPSERRSILQWRRKCCVTKRSSSWVKRSRDTTVLTR